MIREFVLFMGLAALTASGFLCAFYVLARGSWDLGRIAWLMFRVSPGRALPVHEWAADVCSSLQIWLGNSGLGFDSAQEVGSNQPCDCSHVSRSDLSPASVPPRLWSLPHRSLRTPLADPSRKTTFHLPQTIQSPNLPIPSSSQSSSRSSPTLSPPVKRTPELKSSTKGLCELSSGSNQTRCRATCPR